MRAKLVVVLTAWVLMFVPSATSAQSATTGTIAGVVRDATGAVLPGVTVEAASPALIEKVRTVVTDGEGQYKILDLRPGTFTVTFTLTGFNALKREGIELTTGFTATVNAEMRVGSLQETVTVSGATPVVDVQNVRSQSVLSHEVLDALPTAKSLSGYATLTVGMSVSSALQDVGGSRSEQYGFMSIHGNREGEGRQNYDGMRVNNMVSDGAGSARQFIANQAGVQEVAIETAGMSAESETGGVSVNAVPKDGGNTFKVYVNTAYTGKSLQNTNLTDALIARGLTQLASLKQVYDLGIGLGGPLKRDQLWFYTAHRWWGSSLYAPGNFYNLTQGQYIGAPGSGVSPYTPDLSRPAFNQLYQKDNSLRLTWQASPKDKITASAMIQHNCTCHYGVDQLRSPEASYDASFVPSNVLQSAWSHPATSRLLFEAGATYVYSVNSQVYGAQGVTPADIAITELSTGFQYNAWASPALNQASYGKADYNQHNERFSASYVTGSHAFKAGVFTLAGQNTLLSTNVNRDISYQFLKGVPVSLTQFASPGGYSQKVRLNLAIFGQDQWTLRRLTLNMGVRFDSVNAYVPAQRRPAGRFVPALDVAEIDNVPNFKDISPRLGAAYDLFGNGRTAIKGSLGRYVGPSGLSIASAVNPANALVGGTSRTWNDVNGNFIPDCDLSNGAANGECGAFANNKFGTVNITTRYAPDALEGFGNRPNTNWQTSAALQHELRPGLAVNVTYFRTRHSNFLVTQNSALTPADYTPFCITAPLDARLPGGGGNQVCGFYDVMPAKFGQVSNLVTHASNFGEQIDTFNGVDATFTERFGKGGLLQGGVSTGQTVSDACAIATTHPEVTATLPILGQGSTVVTTGPTASTQFCRLTLPFKGQTQFKFSTVYPMPFWDLQAAAAFQSLPGIPFFANYVASNAQIAPSLGRNLAACPAATGACTATATVNVVTPYTLFDDRLNQLDLRFSKSVRVGRARIQGMFDIYNVFNASTILAVNNTYGAAWLRPTAILGARTFKFGAQFDF